MRLARSAVDIPRAAQNFEFFADAITQFGQRVPRRERPVINYTLREPLGAVGCISPWNLPLYLLTWKIAPALAAGNCVVAKPSGDHAHDAHFCSSKLCIEAGLPPGVVNIVHGAGRSAGAALVRASRPRGDLVHRQHARGRGDRATSRRRRFKKVSLELGGKNANIVFADCDFDAPSPAPLRRRSPTRARSASAARASSSNDPLYARFRDALVGARRALQRGRPARSPTTDQGALVSPRAFRKGHRLSRAREGRKAGASSPAARADGCRRPLRRGLASSSPP